ncbi:MAG: glycerol-3-phosphate 1-O-acyltransferase PlsY [Thermoanaerobaculia bacterium]
MSEIVLVVLAAYAIGSIPFSFFVARLASGKDIRTLGSGNVGATNVARTVGKPAGLVALLLDGAKGYLAVRLAEAMLRPDALPAETTAGAWIGVAAVAAVLGHMFPVWLGFRGGKGVATAAGVFLALDPRAFLFSAIVFLIVEIATRFVSLASMLAAATMPLVLRFIERESAWVIVASIVVAIAVILKHHANIARLAHGTEPKFPK